jgi:hypothetical protein
MYRVEVSTFNTKSLQVNNATGAIASQWEAEGSNKVPTSKKVFRRKTLTESPCFENLVLHVGFRHKTIQNCPISVGKNPIILKIACRFQIYN